MNPSSISEPSLDEEIINSSPDNPLSIDSHIDIEPANEELSGAKDWKHIQDFAKLISLGGLGASITLMVNMPSNAAAHRNLYTGYMAAAFNSFFTALVLASYVYTRRSSREVTQKLKRLMFLTLAFLAIACLLRLVFALLFQYLGIQFLFIFAIVILVVVYFYVTPDCKRPSDTNVGVRDS